MQTESACTWSCCSLAVLARAAGRGGDTAAAATSLSLRRAGCRDRSSTECVQEGAAAFSGGFSGRRRTGEEQELRFAVAAGGQVITAAAHSSACNGISVDADIAAPSSNGLSSSNFAFPSRRPLAPLPRSCSRATAGTATPDTAAADMIRDLRVLVDSSGNWRSNINWPAPGLSSCSAVPAAGGTDLSTTEKAVEGRRAAVEAGGATLVRLPALTGGVLPVANGMEFCRASADGAGAVSTSVDDSLVAASARGGSDAAAPGERIAAGTAGGGGMVAPTTVAAAKAGNADAGAASADGTDTCDYVTRVHRPCSSTGRREVETSDLHVSQGQLFSASLVEGSTQSLPAPAGAAAGEEHSAAGFYVEKEWIEDEEPQRDLGGAVVAFEEVLVATSSGLEDCISSCGAVLRPKTGPSCSSRSGDTVENSVAGAEAGHRIGIEGHEVHLKPLGTTDKQQQAGVFSPKEIAAGTGDRQEAATAWGDWRQREGAPVQIEVAVEEKQRHSEGAVFFGGGEQQTSDRERQELQMSEHETESPSLSSVKEQQQEAWRRHNAREDVGPGEPASEVPCGLDTFVEEFFEREQQHDRRERDMLPLQECTSVRSTSIDEVCSYADTLSPLAPSHSCGGSSGASSQASSQHEHHQQELQQEDISGSTAGARQQGEEQQRKNSVDGDAAENRSDREGTRHDAGGGPAIPVRSGGSVQEAVHAVCFTSSRRIAGGLQEETVDELLCHSSTEGRGRGRGRSTKHHLDSKAQKGRSTAARRGRSDTRRHPRARAAADAAACWGKAAGGALAARQGFAAERISSAEGGAAPERGQPEDRGDSGPAGILEGSIGGGIAAAAATAAGGCQPLGVSSSRKRHRSRQHTVTAAPRSAGFGAAAGNALETNAFFSDVGWAVPFQQQQQQRQAQHKQQHQQHIQQQLPYAGAPSGGGPSPCVRGTEGREDVHLSRSRQTWGMQQQQLQLGQHQQQWAQRQQHAQVGLHMQQIQQLHMQQHHVEQQQQQQLQATRATGEAHFFLQESRLVQTGGFPGSTFVRQQQQAAEGWRLRERASAGGSQRLDAQAGVAEASARGVSARRRAGRRREKHSKYGETHAAAGPAATVGDDGQRRRRRPAATFTGPPSQPPAPLRLTAAVLLQLEGRGSLQPQSTRNTPVAVAGPRRGAAARTVNTKKPEAAADAPAKVGEVAVAGGAEEVGGAASGDASVVVEESEGADAAAGAQEDCGVAECEAAAAAAPVDRRGAAAVAAAKEHSTAPAAEKQQGVQEQVGGVCADEGTETERHCEKVAGEDFEAVEGEQEQQERQPGSEEGEQQQPGEQQREEHCTWQALLQQQLEEEEKEGGDPDSTFFWMVKQRAEELRDRTCAGAEHRDGAQGKDAAEEAGADEEGEHPTSGTVQQQRRIRPAAFERAEGLAGPSRDRYAKKSGRRVAAGRTAARRSAVIPGIVAGVERGEAGLQSSGSDVSSEESTKGTVNHRCRDETTRVNLCANPSDMWYGLTTSDGKPVVLPARPSRWHNSSSRRHRRIHREQHRKHKALIARDRLALHLHQLQLQQQQPLQQQFQQQLQLQQQQLQHYQQQQQPLQQPQLQQLLHQRALPHQQQQQQAGQQPPHHQQFSQPPQPHGFGGAVGYPVAGGWVGSQQVVGKHVQYSEREMSVSERGQSFAPATTCRGPVYTSATALSAERNQAYAMAAADKTQVFPPGGATERRNPLSVDRGDLAFARAAADRGQGYLGPRRQAPAHAGVQGLPLHEQQHGSYQQQMGYWGSAARGSSSTRNTAPEEVATGGNAQQRPQQGRSNPQASQQQQQLPPQPFRPGGKQGGHHHPQRRHHYHEHKKRARSSLSSAAAGGGTGTSGSAAAATSSAAPAASVPPAGEEGVVSSFSGSAVVMGASQPQQPFPQQQQRHQQHSRHRRRHPLHHSRRHGGAPSSSSSRSRRSRGNDRLVYVCPEAAAPGGPTVAAPAATGSSAAGTATAGGTAAAGGSAAAERASSAELAVTAGDSSHSRSESATEGYAVAARAAREGGSEGASGVTDSVRAVAAGVATALDETACTSEEKCTSAAAVPSSRDDSGMCLTDATSAAPRTAAPPPIRRGVAHSAGEATGAAGGAAEAAGGRKEHSPRDESISSPQRAPRRARLDESGAFRPVVASSAVGVGGGGVARRKADTQEGRTREGTAGTSHGALPQQTDGGFKVPRPLPFFKRIRRGGVAAAATTGEGVARASSSASARAAAEGRETGPLNSSTSSSSNTKNAHTSSYPNPFPLKPCEPLSHPGATAAGSVCAIAMSASSGVSSESLRTSASALSGSSISSVSSGFGGTSSGSSGSSSSVSGSSVSSSSHSSVWPCSTYGGGADQRPLPSYRDLYCGSSRHSRPVENFAAVTTKPYVPCAQEELVGGGRGSGCRRGLPVQSPNSGRSDTQTEACVDSGEAPRLPNRDAVAAVARAASLPCESVFPTIQGGDPGADKAHLKSNVHPTAACATHALTCPAATSIAAGGGGSAWTDVAGAPPADSMRTSTASCAAAVAASCLAPAAGVASGTPCVTAGSAAGSATTPIGSVSPPVQVGIVVERGTVGVPSSAVYYETPFRRSKPRRGCVGAGGGGSSHSSKKKKVSRKKSRNSSSSSTTQIWCISAREHVQWQLAKSRGML